MRRQSRPSRTSSRGSATCSPPRRTAQRGPSTLCSARLTAARRSSCRTDPRRGRGGGGGSEHGRVACQSSGDCVCRGECRSGRVRRGGRWRGRGGGRCGRRHGRSRHGRRAHRAGSAPRRGLQASERGPVRRARIGGARRPCRGLSRTARPPHRSANRSGDPRCAARKGAQRHPGDSKGGGRGGGGGGRGGCGGGGARGGRCIWLRDLA